MIPYIDLTVKSKNLKKLSIDALKRVMEHGQFINGIEVKNFEDKFSHFLGQKFFTGVASGTAALYLALKSKNIGAGDEVITTPLSYLASTSAITLTGASSVLCDVDETLCLNVNEMRKAISRNTKAVILVHLYGNMGSVAEIAEYCKQNNIILIEDCAQANGSAIGDKKAGSFGDFGCFSFHPLKTLPAMGDAGGICTAEIDSDSWLKIARNHGHTRRNDTSFWSHNLRMDALQASLLSVNLNVYHETLQNRSRQADFYLNEFQNLIHAKKLKVPVKRANVFHSYNMFVILVSQRTEFIKHMAENGIEVKVHYPYTIDELTAASSLVITNDISLAKSAAKEIVSLPMGSHVSKRDLKYISRKVIDFF